MTGRDAEPPVQEVSPKSHPPGRPRVPSYRVMLDVPKDLIWFVSGLLAARRRSIGTRKKTRKLGCYRQAVFGLAWFRDKGSIPRLGAGFGLSQATAYRYLDEVIDVLAEQAPGLLRSAGPDRFSDTVRDESAGQCGGDGDGEPDAIVTRFAY